MDTVHEEPSGGWRQIPTLASLRYRNYRLLWIGTLISHSGDWMDQIALNWLMLVLTNSPFYLGLLNLVRGVPILLLTLVGGVLADRMERRKLLVITQSASMALAFILGALVSTGLIQVWQLLIISTLRGITMSFHMPARQTIISDMVPRKDLANAIALNATTMNLTRIIGPTIAGLLIATLGISSPFYLNGISFLAVIYTLYAMQFPPAPATSQAPTAMHQELREVLGYVRRSPMLISLIIIALVPMFLGHPYMTMLTVFARDVLSVGATGLGILTAASSVGAVVGGLAVASAGNSTRKWPIMLISMMGFGVALVLFSMSRWALVSAILLLAVGAMNTAFNSVNNTILQLAAPDHLRGRLVSILFLNRGMVPLGTALAGFLATLIGAPLAVGLMAGTLILVGLGVVAMVPSTLRSGELNPRP